MAILPGPSLSLPPSLLPSFPLPFLPLSLPLSFQMKICYVYVYRRSSGK